jgi:hypothetical protein
MRHAPGGYQKFLRRVQDVRVEAQQVALRVSDRSSFWQPGGGFDLRYGDPNESPTGQASADYREPIVTRVVAELCEKLKPFYSDIVAASASSESCARKSSFTSRPHSKTSTSQMKGSHQEFCGWYPNTPCARKMRTFKSRFV